MRGPPRPLCPRAALGSRGRPCAPGPAGQQARGGGGNRARARRAGRRRPRSSSLSATWRDGGGGALGLIWGCRPGPQVGAGCGLRRHPLPTQGWEGRAPPPLPCPRGPGASEFGRPSPRRDSRSPRRQHFLLGAPRDLGRQLCPTAAGAALALAPRPDPGSRIGNSHRSSEFKLSLSFQPGPQPPLEPRMKTKPSGEH